MKIWIAEIESIFGYTLRAVGSTPEKAMSNLKKGLSELVRSRGGIKQVNHRGNFFNSLNHMMEYYGAHVNEFEVDKPAVMI